MHCQGKVPWGGAGVTAGHHGAKCLPPSMPPPSKRRSRAPFPLTSGRDAHESTCLTQYSILNTPGRDPWNLRRHLCSKCFKELWQENWPLPPGQPESQMSKLDQMSNLWLIFNPNYVGVKSRKERWRGRAHCAPPLLFLPNYTGYVLLIS